MERSGTVTIKGNPFTLVGAPLNVGDQLPNVITLSEVKAMIPKWLDWTQRLLAIAQNGLHYARDPFDVERYEDAREIAAEMAASFSDADAGVLHALFAGEAGHAAPKVDVRAAVFRNNAILLVRERSEGLWTLPGGWADIGESPGEAVAREAYEESGYRVRAVKVLAVYDRNKHPHPPFPFHTCKVFFQCELTGGEPAHSVETDAVGFFREDELPELSVMRVTPEQIGRFFQHYRHPDWPTDFD
jgi:ADP-ribose pyrophosphatase YjhB (NUDIX family)